MESATPIYVKQRRRPPAVMAEAIDDAIEIEIEDVSFRARACRTRLPFRFGVVTLTSAPVLTARVRLRADGRAFDGYAADLCVPKWFEKDPSKRLIDDFETLFASAARAAEAFRGGRGSAFGVWLGAYRRCVEGEQASGVALVDGFGVALVERAMIDATCRTAGLAFADAVARGALGFEPGRVLPTASGIAVSDVVATPRPKRVLVRHTVGGLDPLRPEEVTPEQRGVDEHPVALAEDIRRFGLRAFKLKCGGEPEQDARRLAAIARVVRDEGVDDAIYSLDANESYASVREVEALLDRLETDRDARRILDGLAYLEQPLPRDRTLDASGRDDVARLARRVPLLIDEADDRLDAFERALALGYRGVSVKNCKGVFRALTNRALCLAHGDGAFQTSEDLTNLPVLPLQQDLTSLAALGLEHSERNGHHFFPGLDVVSKAEAEAALAAQPDLYVRRGERIVLRIEDGGISLACAEAPGFGVASAIDWSSREPAEETLTANREAWSE